MDGVLDAHLLINGEDTGARAGGRFDILDPVQGTVTSRGTAAKAADADAAANAAAAAFAGWSRTLPAVRRAILMRAAALVELYAPRIAACMQRELGATPLWVEFNVKLARAHLEEAASIVTLLTGSVGPSPEGLVFAMREPVGVCLAIAPWNAPFVLGMRAVAMPLACGNAVVFKASEMCPATHRLIGDILTEAGVPPGVFNLLTNAPEDAAEVVGALIAHPAVRRVNFTGSTRVGRIVAETAARHLKRCLLELGGKSPLIVLDDADLEAAAGAAAFGAFLNQGQICMSTDRIIVLDSVADAFAALLADQARRLRAGDPRLQQFPLGPIASPAMARRLSDLVRDAVAKGGTLLTGGPATGHYMDATVIDNLSPAMLMYSEECFGPLAGICRVASVDEAITVANDSAYGLSAAVFGRDLARALDVARSLETGICHINAPTVQDRPDMPFGGVKASGYGRFGGPAAYDEFTELRWISLGAGPHDTRL